MERIKRLEKGEGPCAQRRREDRREKEVAEGVTESSELEFLEEQRNCTNCRKDLVKRWALHNFCV